MERNYKNIHINPWLEPEKLAAVSVKFDAAWLIVNPKSLIAFPYKSFTYFAAGLPVISNIRGGELQQLISGNNLGITIENDSAESMKKALYTLIQKNASRTEIQQFARKNFDSQSIYRKYCIWALAVLSGKA